MYVGKSLPSSSQFWLKFASFFITMILVMQNYIMCCVFYVNTHYVSVLGKIAIGVMEHYVHFNGDHSPEVSRILMPQGVNIKDIYTENKNLYRANQQVSQGQFYKLWQKHFSHVSFYKVI